MEYCPGFSQKGSGWTSNLCKYSSWLRWVRSVERIPLNLLRDHLATPTFEIEVITAPKIFLTGDTKMSLGNNLQLSCESTGFTEPQITWKKNGNPVSTTGKLFIPNIEKYHAGIYSCDAENSHSTSRKEVLVEVLYKPRVKPLTNRFTSIT